VALEVFGLVGEGSCDEAISWFEEGREETISVEIATGDRLLEADRRL